MNTLKYDFVNLFQKLEFTENGVLYAEGEKCMTKGMGGVAELEKITEEEAIAIQNAGDPIDAPPGKK